jgi:hypothetical protein
VNKQQTVEALPLTLRANVEPASIDPEARTCDLVFSTGAGVMRYDWATGERFIETLSLDPKHIRLERLNTGAPFLNAHSAWDVSDVLGVVVDDSVRIEKGAARARVRFSKRADVDAIWQDVRDGILRNVSVGYRVYEYQQTTGKDGKLPTRHAVDWEPFEISAVPIPADSGAQIRTAMAKTPTNPCVIVTREEEITAMNETATATPETKPAPAAAVPIPSTEEVRASAVQAERARVAGITAAVRAAKLEASIADKMIADGVSLDAARAQVLDELAKRDATKPTEQHVVVVAGEDEAVKWQRGVAAWLWQKAAVAGTVRAAAKAQPEHEAFRGIALDPGEFRGLTLLDLARQSLERRGVSTRGMDKMRLVGTALTHRSGAQTTSDFAVALETALHKTLLAAYAVTPDTWSAFCKVGSVGDFRAHTRYRMGTFSRLDKVLESGEFKNKAIPDAAKETITAATYGNIIALTRQAIVNDDMGVFTDLATMLGRAGRLSIEVDVYALLALNSGAGPAMADGKALFHADHNNISTGAALTAAAIDADRVQLASQTDPSGNEILDLRPAVLVLPISLGGTARSINEAQYDPDTANKLQKPNTVRGLFERVVDTPRISGTRRYIFASPSVAPTVEVAFLDGNQEPFLESEDGWRIDGVEWKVRLDYAVGGVDYRGAVTNAGA